MIDLISAQKIGNTLGIDQFSIVKEFVQVIFLNEFYALPSVGKTIFKGGTALKLLFGSNRFSEDLDFTTDLSKEKIDSLLIKTIREIEKQVPGIKIKDMKAISGISKKLSLPLKEIPSELTIKLDFSQREKVFFIKQGTIKTTLPISSTVLVSYLDPKEVLSEKYRAIMTRIKGRDIYDFWFLLSKGISLDPVLTRKKLSYYNESFNFTQFISKIEDWNEKELDQDVRKFLPQKDRVVLTKLKELLIQELNNYSPKLV